MNNELRESFNASEALRSAIAEREYDDQRTLDIIERIAVSVAIDRSTTTSEVMCEGIRIVYYVFFPDNDKFAASPEWDRGTIDRYKSAMLQFGFTSSDALAILLEEIIDFLADGDPEVRRAVFVKHANTIDIEFRWRNRARNYDESICPEFRAKYYKMLGLDVKEGGK